MKCTKCGKQVKKTDKFCQYCGTTVKAEEEKKTTTKKVVAEKKKTETKKVAPKKTTPVKKEVKEEVKVEKTEAPQARKKGFGIAGMVLGILSIIFCWCGLWVVIFPILGLVFSLISKKNGFKVVGIITSAVGFLLQIIVTILTVAVFSSFLGVLEEELEDYTYTNSYNNTTTTTTYKYASPYGEWTCTPYPENEYKTKEETTLKFNYNGTFMYGPKNGLSNNYYSGNFTYTKEYDKNKQYSDREFMDIKAPVDKFVVSGVEQDASNKNLNMEIEFINDYKEAIIMFYNTYNTYYCKK